MWTSCTAFSKLYYVWCLLWEHLLFKDSEAWPVSHPLETFALEGAKRRLACPVQPKELLSVITVLAIAAHFASSALLSDVCFLLTLLVGFAGFFRIDELRYIALHDVYI